MNVHRLVGFLLPATVAATLLLGGGTARANYSLTITTTGTVSSLSDPTNLLGAGTSLSTGAYSINVYYADVGGAFVTTNPGVYQAFDDNTASGFITVTVNGHSLSTGFSTNGTANLLEQTAKIVDSITATDARGNQALAVQTISATSAFLANPDLEQSRSFALGSLIQGTDFYSFISAGNTAAISLSGIPSHISLVVPEPGSVALLGGALMSLVLATRRRRALR